MIEQIFRLGGGALLAVGLAACGGGGGIGSPAPVGGPATGTAQGGAVPAGGACAGKGADAALRDQRGEATYYAAGGTVACGLPLPADGMVAAINTAQYAGSAACGVCLRVRGPQGAVVVQVVDRCPECGAGDLDLNEAAFARIADPAQGRVAIRWSEVPCASAAPLQYHFKSGSSPWWLAVQVRNARHRVLQFEVRDGEGAFRVLPRLDYNYFVAKSGMGPGPYTFRVTDLYGQRIEDGSIPLQAGSTVQSHAQFPDCPE